jgi:hypothetical protein
VLDNKLGFFSTHFAHADVAFAAHPTGVEHIALIGVLFARRVIGMATSCALA